MTAAVEVAPPVSPLPPRERQSKPVQGVVAPALPEPLPPGAGDATTVVGGVDWVVEGKVDRVEVAAGPLPPRLKDRQRSPVQGTVVAVVALLVAPAAGDKIELDTDDGEAASADDKGTIDVDPAVGAALDEAPIPSDRHNSPVQGEVVVASIVVVAPRVIGVVDNPKVEVALDRTPNEALTQSRLVHPNGSVEVGLAGAATGDVEGVVNNRPVTDVVLERESKETLTQRRFEQPNGKVAEEDSTIESVEKLGGCYQKVLESVKDPTIELVEKSGGCYQIPELVIDPRVESIEKLESIIDPTVESIEKLESVIDPKTESVEKLKSVMDPKTESVEKLKSVMDPKTESVEKLKSVMDPKTESVEKLKSVIDPKTESVEKLGGYYQKILESVIDPTVSVEKLESVTDPTIELVKKLGGCYQKWLDRTIFLRTIGLSMKQIHHRVELRGVVPDAWQEGPTHKLRQASPEHEAAEDVDALVVAGIDDTVLDNDVLIDGAVFVRETVQPPRFKQAFTQRSSVHVVVDAGAVWIVDRGLELPVRLGLEVAKIGDDGLEGVVPGPEALLVKDTVHPNPRFRQAFTQRRSVQVAVVTGVVVGFEVPEVILVNCVNPDSDAVVPRPQLDVPVPVEAVELLRLGFGTHVGPIHRLRQSAPEHEGVGVKRVLVVPQLDNTLDETVGIATVDGMKADPEDMMAGDVPERADDNVDKDAVETKTGVLIVRLLVVLPKAVGLVTVLVGMMVEQPSPEQRVTHVTPLQDVVIENDKLGPLERTNVEEVNGVVRALKFVTVGLLKMVDGGVLDAKVEIVPVDIEDAKFDEMGLEEMEVDMVAADVGKIKDEMVCWVVVVVQV
ncbi:MAG: hypothetical protein Q9199_005190 [Rusavskia elegans]